MADAPQASATSSIEDQIRLREQKAQMLREKGAHPYGNGVVVPHTTGFVRVRHEDDDAQRLEDDQSEPYGVAGRIVAMRTMGKACFLSLRDRTRDLQIFVKKDKVGEQAYELLKLADLGDIAFARGRAMRTKTGELSIEARDDRLLRIRQMVLPRSQPTNGRIIGMRIAIGLCEARVVDTSCVVGQGEHARFFEIDPQEVTQRARNSNRIRRQILVLDNMILVWVRVGPCQTYRNGPAPTSTLRRDIKLLPPLVPTKRSVLMTCYHVEWVTY